MCAKRELEEASNGNARASTPTPALPQRGREEEGRNYRGGRPFADLVGLARELRRNQTEAERLQWSLLRKRQFMGLKFRRQHQIGDYIADLYCHEIRLVVELDGPVHSEPGTQQTDAERDAYLRSLGLTILRLPNEVALGAPSKIRESAEARRSASGLPSPSEGRTEDGGPRP